uniref:carbohydrate kinase family protein n=1 Tax=Yersinia frederiksenii TaxID=29484 RepID=UPI001F4C1221|nr:carbohydrate kinase family protein [Yersinia frederiksenii]ULG19854.1 carbohydrate kinase family protein [Yersinia frederiksenii]
MKVFDVVAVGSGTVDLIFRVPRLPGNDDKVVGKKIAELPGGMVANSACAMGKLGLKVTSLSTVGNDHHAQTIINDFLKNNVDVSFVQHKPGIEANMAVIFLDDSGEKALVYAPNNETETSMKVAYEAIACSKAVYMVPSQLNKFKTLAQHAKKEQTKVMVDIESHINNSQRYIREILLLSDVAIFNKEGFHISLQQEPTKEFLMKLVEDNCLDYIVVTCGGEGVVACNKKEYATHPGYRISVVDTTGAGDTFNGAFMYCYLNNMNLQDALTFASAAAAINISYTGPRGKLPTIDDVRRFIAQGINN